MKVKPALNWIIDFLETQNIPYLICGGLAAIAYGAKRPLHDIDLYVPDANYREVIKFGDQFISLGPQRWNDKHWSVDYVQFTYKGQLIEVGSSKQIQIFDATKNSWLSKELDFSKYTKVLVFGKSVRIMDKEILLDYKEKLNREVDRIDIKQIKETANEFKTSS